MQASCKPKLVWSDRMASILDVYHGDKEMNRTTRLKSLMGAVLFALSIKVSLEEATRIRNFADDAVENVLRTMVHAQARIREAAKGKSIRNIGRNVLTVLLQGREDIVQLL